MGQLRGAGSAMLTAGGTIHRVNEVAAIVEGALILDPDCASIIEMGGQTAKFITGFTRGDKRHVEVSMSANCSSGTGSFLEEQVSRLGMDIEDYSGRAARSTFTPRIAGRCSVFAKTDIIHHQQEGVAVPDILAGLAHAVVKNYRSAVMRRLPRKKPMLFAGGVCRNSAIVKAMTAVLKLEPEELRIREHTDLIGAIGAARLAVREKKTLDPAAVTIALVTAPALNIHMHEDLQLRPLDGFGLDDARNKHTLDPLPASGRTDCWLGIDVGSTSTNLVLTDARDHVVGYRYLRTAGKPVRAVRTGLAELGREFGDRIRIRGVATTGSGRIMIGRLVGADVVRDEITAQARAAVAIDPTVDTIFEIGGQDSKYISLNDGAVSDFAMNKICAAGTGSFIEEQAKKLGVDLDAIGATALSATAPTSLGERCTVFMESSIGAHLGQGTGINDLAAGLCYSIVKNYINRVVGRKPVGGKIFLQGGVAHNQGVCQRLPGSHRSGCEGATVFQRHWRIGAAILAREEMQVAGSVTAFNGFEPGEVDGQAIKTASSTMIESDFNRTVQEFIFTGYDDLLNLDKKTVGIPRALFTYGMFPMFHPFLRSLG